MYSLAFYLWVEELVNLWVNVIIVILIDNIAACPQLKIPKHAILNDTVVTQGTVVSISCTKGYSLVGSKTLVCMPYGFWNSDLPVCKKGKLIIYPVSHLRKTEDSTKSSNNNRIPAQTTGIHIHLGSFNDYLWMASRWGRSSCGLESPCDLSNSLFIPIYVLE